MAKAKEMQESESSRQNQGQQNQAVSRSQQDSSPAMARREPFGISSWVGDPFLMMNRFAEEVDRIFENFGMGRGALSTRFGQFPARGTGGTSQTLWSPQVEMFEREGKLHVRADLPGMNKDDVKVEITDGGLTIQGERRSEHKEDREGFYRSERSYGSFFRTIPLPEGVNAGNAQASFRDGVLEITMPAPQRQENRRQIEIK
ncbi:MAG TPA: Hsp20/alpha crystallin family protein [Blastocatellia bacterium]|nr:Hsp20/alpha crystallin family protein [Blastocatellia bacterium]